MSTDPATNLPPSYIIYSSPYDHLYNGDVPDEVPVGTVVATFTASDPEGEAVTFSLKDFSVRDLYHYEENRFTPTDDFKIVGNQLVVAQPLNTYKYGIYWQYIYQVSASDPEGNSVSISRGLTTITLRDDLKGTASNDELRAPDHATKIFGYAGDDRLVGGDKDDILYGGEGRDVLAGKGGHDTFLFKHVYESSVERPDVIIGWQHTLPTGGRGDIIDLRQIDADTSDVMDDVFSWLGTKKFSGHAGELRYEQQAKHTYIYGDVDGDKKADFAIDIQGSFKMYSNDFWL